MNQNVAIVSSILGLVSASMLTGQADWSTAYPTPRPRAVHAATWDLTNNELVMFGGNTNNGYQGETHTWTAAGGWRRHSPAVEPSDRREHAMAYDIANGNVVLFGGWDGAPSNETWLWDGTSWSLAAPSNSPVGRWGHVMTFDPGSGMVMLHGGYDDNAGAYLDDTWLWNGTDWQLVITPNSPGPRRDHAIATDLVMMPRVFLFGGYNGSTSLQDTWQWDGAAMNWTQVAATGPSIRYEHGLAFDGSRFTLFGGDNLPGVRRLNDTWAFDGTSWVQLTPANSPPKREEHVLVQTGVAGCILFGGWDSPFGHMGDTWTFDGNDWTSLTPTDVPIGTGAAGAAFDPNTASIIMFGGYQDTQQSDQTWRRQNGVWTELQPSTRPVTRHETAMAYDEARQEFILFAGRTDAGVYLNDTVAFDGVNWIPKSPAMSPPPRRIHAMTYNEARSTVVVFGGWNGSANLNDTWEWDGTTWTQLLTATSPQVRHDHWLAYDRNREEVLLFGGWDGMFLGDFWALRDTGGGVWDWVQLMPATLPSARSEHTMCYDSVRDRTVLFGGEDASGRVNDTWEWDGSDWILRSPTQSPEEREEHIMVFDSVAGECVVAVGWNRGHLHDTWTYSSSAVASQSPYGTSCAGALSATDPWLGELLSFQATGLPASTAAAVVMFGAGQTSVPLDLVGMPGCSLLTDGFFNGQMVLSGSTATFAFTPLPSAGALGVSISNQVFAIAPGVNALGLVSTGALDMTYGLK